MEPNSSPPSSASRQLRMAIALVVSPLLGTVAIYPLVGNAADCAFCIAYLVGATLGMPVAIWLAGRRAPWWQYTLWGAFVGALPFLPYDALYLVGVFARRRFYPFVAHDMKHWLLPLLAGGTACGAVTATLMWAMVFWRED